MSEKRSPESREYKRVWQKRRRAENKDLFASLFGHTCSVCEAIVHPAALDFHHRDPSAKSFGITKSSGRSLDTLMEELAKCDPICSNCHRELHHDV